MTGRPLPGDLIAVWFSCGAASAVAAKLTVEQHPAEVVRILNNPVAEEDEDNRRFLRDVEAWVGVEIETVVNPAFPSASAKEVWAQRKAMAFPGGAPCTVELKKRARQVWENEHRPNWHVLGFTADEAKRHERFTRSERENVLPVLIEAKMTKDDCYAMLKREGIEPPRIYKQGYPNANCIGCVKATSPTYWNHVRDKHPEIFEQRSKQSRELGARLVRYKGQRVFLDELPADAKGRPMKNMDVECGSFCEEFDPS